MDNQKQFENELWALCMRAKKRVGVANVAASLVVHAARFCSELGPQFIQVAKQKWESTTAEFLQTLEDSAAKEDYSNEPRQ